MARAPKPESRAGRAAASIGAFGSSRSASSEIKATVRIAHPYGFGDRQCLSVARDIEMRGPHEESRFRWRRPRQARCRQVGSGRGKDFPARAKRIKADDKGVCGGCVLDAVERVRGKRDRCGVAGGDHALDAVEVGRVPPWARAGRETATRIGADIQ